MPIKRFEQYISLEKRYSPHTVKAYINDLNNLQQFISTQYEGTALASANTSMIRSFLASRLDSGISARSVNRSLTTFRTFYRYLLRVAIIERSPMQPISGLKTAETLPEFVSQDALSELFEEDASDGSDTFATLRDRLIIQIFYATGMRVSELVGLKRSDMDFVKKQIRVLGKRQKVRFIPITNQLIELASAYLEQRDAVFGASNSDIFFVTDKGSPIYSKWVYRKTKHYLSTVTTQQKRGPHILRHTFATHMLSNGADINAIKEVLGHASLAATQVYTHTSIDELKQVYKQAHPGPKQ